MKRLAGWGTVDQLNPLASGTSNIQAIVKVRPYPLPLRVTADDRTAHREFVRTLGSDAIWLDYFTIRSTWGARHDAAMAWIKRPCDGRCRWRAPSHPIISTHANGSRLATSGTTPLITAR
jgi:hypothetical protein